MERDPAAVLQAAIRGVVDRLPDSVKEDTTDAALEFKPAKYFTGAKAGFYFGSGSRGTGYYVDPLAVVQRPVEGQKAERAALNAEDLLREAEEQVGDQEVQLLDSRSLKRLVAAFERKYKENLEARMKYADQPEKFMESEVDLDEEVQRLLVVAGSPELYPEFVRSGAIENLMALLSHDNADIAADVIELFQQLTDADVIEDSQEEAIVLVESVLEHNGIELLVHRLTSLVEAASDDEGKAVFNTLSIFENMIEVKPEVAEMVLERSKLLKWMLARLRPREFDSNKQYTAELLAILLQSSPKNQQSLADANGIDVLLQAIAPYKNRNPGSIDEEEYLENLFNSLCACLMSEETRNLFLRAEGVELMLLILKQKRLARAGALKALDFATTRSPANCERFVDQFGLRTISAIFMGKAKLKRRKGEDAEEAEEEARALSVLANLFQGLARGSRRDRLAAKFVENEFEKCDRLMELFVRYFGRVQAAERELGEEGLEEMSPEERLLARLDEGLYSLQQTALILGHLWFVGDMGIRKRLLQLLHQKSLALASVRDILAEFLDSIGDEGSAAEAERERQRVRRMLTALGQERVEEPGAAPASAAALQLPEAQGEARVESGAEAGALKADGRANGGPLEESQPPLPPEHDSTVSRDSEGKKSSHKEERATDTNPRSESGKRHEEEERRKERKRREDKERRHKEDRDSRKTEEDPHDTRHAHRDERDRRHREDKERRSRDDRDSRKDRDRSRREHDERRDRKRERR